MYELYSKLYAFSKTATILKNANFQVLVESVLLFVLMAVVLALILNLDISYGCGSCSKSQGIVLR